MTLQIRRGGSWITPTGLKIYKAGAWRSIQAIKIYAGGAWRDVANFTPPSGGGGGGGGAIVLTLSRTSINKATFSSTGSTANVTATPSGGLAPYTYSWTRISGSGINANTPSSATTSFQATGLSEDETRTATFRCTCTDSLGTSDAEDCAVSITRQTLS